MKCGKIEKCLKCHGWGSHKGTWKMGKWGQNIALETLHVLMGYVSRLKLLGN